MAVWSAGLGVAGSVLAVAFLAWGMSDVDGDGAASFQEMGVGTQPMRADSDGDGAMDGWELARGFDPMQGEAFESLGSTPSVGCQLSLSTCDEPETEASQQPPPPTVSDNQAQLRTGLLALGAAMVASVAGIFTGRVVR
ncbi:MAG: hypothetical protein ACPHID_05595 [Thermoplasmatota archaeon]